jgi:hypothetical protein
VKELVHKNRRITTCKIASMLGISVQPVHTILNDNLNMSQIAAKFMPHLMSGEQLENHVKMSHEPRSSRDPELKIITGDVMRVYRYDLDTKQLFSQQMSPRNARLVPSNIKSMLPAFLYSRRYSLQICSPKTNCKNKKETLLH